MIGNAVYMFYSLFVFDWLLLFCFLSLLFACIFFFFFLFEMNNLWENRFSFGTRMRTSSHLFSTIHCNSRIVFVFISRAYNQFRLKFENLRKKKRKEKIKTKHLVSVCVCDFVGEWVYGFSKHIPHRPYSALCVHVLKAFFQLICFVFILVFGYYVFVFFFFYFVPFLFFPYRSLCVCVCVLSLKHLIISNLRQHHYQLLLNWKMLLTLPNYCPQYYW